MSYQISNRTKKIAKHLGYEVEPSTVGYKKISVFRDSKKVADIGDRRYEDYHTYKKKYGQKIAEQRRKAYYQRHKSNIRSGNGRLSWLLLWS